MRRPRHGNQLLTQHADRADEQGEILLYSILFPDMWGNVSCEHSILEYGFEKEWIRREGR